jgi:hypothetical protein
MCDCKPAALRVKIGNFGDNSRRGLGNLLNSGALATILVAGGETSTPTGLSRVDIGFLSISAMKWLTPFAYSLVAAIAISFAFSGSASAQGFGQPIAGVEVDATGVLRVKQFDPRVAQQRLLAARNAAGAEVMKRSPLRKVSLNRLEAAVASAIAGGDSPSDEMLSMAGLTRIEYVFFYPDSNDIVIAGPAEGFVEDPAGRMVGIETGKPIVMLEDMVTALRAFAPGQKPTNVISVSIDPTQEGLQRLNQVLQAVRGNLRPSDAEELARTLKQNLGLQTVSIRGIPHSTNFARVLVEADYRMKLIGIGLEQLPVPMASYVERANPSQIASNAMERWFFVPNYDGVSVSDDGLAMKLNDRGVKLVGENERVGADGKRAASGKTNRASASFCLDFTKKYSMIADRVPVYAEMRNLIDSAIAAAYIQQQDFYGQANWDMAVFGDESKFAVETHTAPQQVETAVNAIWKGNTLMTPLGGGVNVQPRQALTSERLVVETDGATNELKQTVAPTKLAEGQWWWD